MFFERQHADVWDSMYEQGRGKDYAGEAATVAGTILRSCPGARSLLDVGCGTGSHLSVLSKHFDHVEGVDISPAMVSVAAAKVPDATVSVADMCELDLGRRFDAVVSLYTVVGYLPSTDALHRAIRRMVAHVAPGGVLIVEPWWFVDRFIDDYVATDVVETPDRTMSRMSRTTRHGDRAHMEIHYLVADSDGVEHFTENHTFGLWSRADYERAFAAAGCAMDYVDDVLYCGMFVGRPDAVR